MGGISIVMLVGTLMAVPVVVAWLPRDYFRRRRRWELLQASRHPGLRLAWWIVKNLVGTLLILLGVAMLLLPGQGILTILLGLILLDFPGKRRMELALVRQPKVFNSLNWFRRKMGRPPFELDPPARKPKPSTKKPNGFRGLFP